MRISENDTEFRPRDHGLMRHDGMEKTASTVADAVRRAHDGICGQNHDVGRSRSAARTVAAQDADWRSARRRGKRLDGDAALQATVVKRDVAAWDYDTSIGPLITELKAPSRRGSAPPPPRTSEARLIQPGGRDGADQLQREETPQKGVHRRFILGPMVQDMS